MKKVLAIICAFVGFPDAVSAAGISYTHLGVDLLAITFDEPVRVAGYEVEGLVGANIEGSWGFHDNLFVRFSSYAAGNESEDGYLEVMESGASLALGANVSPMESLSLYAFYGPVTGEVEVCAPFCATSDYDGSAFQFGARFKPVQLFEIALARSSIDYDDAGIDTETATKLAATLYFTRNHSARLAVSSSDEDVTATTLGYKYYW